MNAEQLIELCQQDLSNVPKAQAQAREEIARGVYDTVFAFKAACYDDLALFASFFLSSANIVSLAPAKHHYAFYSVYNSGWGSEKINFIAPRGTAKTTVGMKIVAIHGACYFNLEGWKDRDPERMTGHPFTVIASASSGKAEDDLRAIKAAIDINDLLCAAFAHPLGRDSLRVREEKSYFKWNESSIVLANGAQIDAIGRGSQIRGRTNFMNFRPTLFIGDDLEGQKNVTNDQLIVDTRNWLSNEVEPGVMDEPSYNGRVIILGTIVHDQCLVAHLKRNDPSYETLFYQIIVTDKDGVEKSLWPEKHPLKKIYAKRAQAERGGRLSSWLQEYMNVAMAKEERPFRPDQIRYWEGEFQRTKTPGLGLLVVHNAFTYDRNKKVDLPEYIPVNIWIGVDFASTDSVTADFTVMSVVATDQKGNCFLVDYIRDRLLTPSSRATALFGLVEKYGPNAAVIETIGDQNTTMMHFREVQREKNIWFRMIPEKHRRQESKQERITGDLEPRFNAGSFYFKASGQSTAIQEFTEFPQGEHDDIPDSVQMAVHHSRRCPYVSLPDARDRDRERDEEHEFDALTAA